MNRFFGSWASNDAPNNSGLQKGPQNESEELDRFLQALEATNLIMNEDIDLAESKLHAGTSVFHVLGRGVVLFLKAVLGFEQVTMKLAASRLIEAETMASKEVQRAQKDPRGWRSEIYPAGTQYAICLATAQIMLAALAVLSQSVTESIKGFYKLRKALQTLQATTEAEAKYMKTRSDQVPASGASIQGSGDEMKKACLHTLDEWITSATLSQYGMILTIISMVPAGFTRFLSIVGFRGDREQGLSMLWRASQHADFNGGTAGLFLLGYFNDLVACLDIRPANGYPLERLQDLLKMMRARYPKSQFWLLEEARMRSAEKSLEAAVTLIKQHESILAPMANNHVEDSSTITYATPENRKNAPDAPKTSFKQLAGQKLFRMSLDLMYLHDYQACADSFIKYIGLTDWGHGIYYYTAGAAHLELYRIYKQGGTLPDFSTNPTSFRSVEESPKKEVHHADLASKYLEEATKHTGKKRIFGRPLPFDDLVARKINKWRKSVETHKCSIVDAVGPSPFEELIYFWNGYGRMLPAQLEHSLQRLSWSQESPTFSHTSPGDGSPPGSKVSTNDQVDDAAVTAVLRASVYRHLGRTSEASTLLRTDIIEKFTWAEFKAGASNGNFGDTYPLPIAQYELAVCLWSERFAAEGGPGKTVKDENGATLDRDIVERCGKVLAQIARWETFDLDQQVQIKISTGQETIKKLLSA